jgi:hypothetical protein
MLEIFEFTELYDPQLDVEGILISLQDKGKIDNSHTSVDTLSDKELAKFNELANVEKKYIA